MNFPEQDDLHDTFSGGLSCAFSSLGIFSLWGLDSDGDGYSDEVENRYDWNASLTDQRIRGGISKTAS